MINDQNSDIWAVLLRIKIFAVMTVFCFVSLLVLLLTNVLSKRYYNDISRILENQVQTQLDHYERRERANTELRRFRHDYNNHINCIRSLLGAGRYDDVSEYLNKLSDMLPSGGTSFSTGNYLADAILADKQEIARKNDITIAFNGTIPDFINNTDLCIILTNALDNAIEACSICESERSIAVFGGYRHGYFILTVKNPTTNSIADTSSLPVTTKEDKQHHGYGLLNISKVIEKYDGFMMHECKDGQFVLKLTFNNIVSDNTVSIGTTQNTL